MSPAPTSTSDREDVRAGDEGRVVDQVPTSLLIGGEWIAAADGGTFEVADPSTGQLLTAVADATPADGMAAMDAAVTAQPGLAAMAPRERADVLMAAFDLLHDRLDDLALLMTLEMGKPLAESKGEIAYAAEYFRHFAEEAVRIGGDYRTVPAGGARMIVLRQPVGPALLITPLGTFRWRWAPARSARRWRPGARPSSNRPGRPRCRCWRSAPSCSRRGARRAR